MTRDNKDNDKDIDTAEDIEELLGLLHDDPTGEPPPGFDYLLTLVGEAEPRAPAPAIATATLGRGATTRRKKRRGTLPRNERHVVPSEGGGWDVVKPGSDRASAHKDTQAEAIDRAREIVGNDGGGEVVIHGRDGRIRDSDTVPPGNDPNPPRDKK